MKYSILLPYYDPEFKKTLPFTRLIKSIVENSKDADYELVIQKDGPSYVESHNRALKAAKGDYIIVLNDDVEIHDPKWLEKLTDDEAITSWRLGAYHMHPESMPDAACFQMSRQTFEKLGLMDEIYKDGMNYEDTDYFLRAREMGIPFKNAEVNLTHLGYETAKNYSTEAATSPLKEINRGIFCKRWLK